MTEEKVETTEKKTSVRKKPVARKKTAAKKKTSVRKKTSVKHLESAATSRHALTDRLKKDLKATKQVLSDAKAAASEEIKLAKVVAKNEIAVLKDQLAAALKREKELVKLSKLKA